MGGITWGVPDGGIETLRIAFFGGMAALYGMLGLLRASPELEGAVAAELSMLCRVLEEANRGEDGD